jgi:hypothetical protein
MNALEKKVMVDEAPTARRAANVRESLVNVRPTLVPGSQAAVAVEPRERALNYPTMPARPLDSMPRRALRGVMLRFRNFARSGL